LTFSAGQGEAFHAVTSDDAYAGFDCVEDFFVGKAAGVFADLAADAFVGVSGNEFSIVERDHV
jgi:hypothetical protein